MMNRQWDEKYKMGANEPLKNLSHPAIKTLGFYIQEHFDEMAHRLGISNDKLIKIKSDPYKGFKLLELWSEHPGATIQYLAMVFNNMNSESLKDRLEELRWDPVDLLVCLDKEHTLELKEPSRTPVNEALQYYCQKIYGEKEVIYEILGHLRWWEKTCGQIKGTEVHVDIKLVDNSEHIHQLPGFQDVDRETVSQIYIILRITYTADIILKSSERSGTYMIRPRKCSRYRSYALSALYNNTVVHFIIHDKQEESTRKPKFFFFDDGPDFYRVRLLIQHYKQQQFQTKTELVPSFTLSEPFEPQRS